jgi:hypothetical protein
VRFGCSGSQSYACHPVSEANALPPPSGEAVAVTESVFQLSERFRRSDSVPAQLLLGLHGAAAAHRFHDLGHEVAMSVPAETGLHFVERFS